MTTATHGRQNATLSFIGSSISLLLPTGGFAGCEAEAGATSARFEITQAALQHAGGAVSCDFNLPLTMNPLEIAPIIERDRMYMAARPGFLEKHIPMNPSVLGLGIQTGGRYLFDTFADARRYLDWARNDFVLDGTHFFDRSYFLSPKCQVWHVVGAYEPGDPRTQHHLIRTERFRAPSKHNRSAVEQRWEAIRAEAERRGLSGVRLSYAPEAQRIEIIHLANRDVFSLLALESLPTLGLPLIEDGCSKEFDRTQFVLTIWFPFVPGDRGEPAPFPNSPPLPAPLCLDGVCEVSRGEDGASCPLDCPPRCGDAVCQPEENENTQNCPGDCRLD